MKSLLINILFIVHLVLYLPVFLNLIVFEFEFYLLVLLFVLVYDLSDRNFFHGFDSTFFLILSLNISYLKKIFFDLTLSFSVFRLNFPVYPAMIFILLKKYQFTNHYLHIDFEEFFNLLFKSK